MQRTAHHAGPCCWITLHPVRRLLQAAQAAAAGIEPAHGVRHLCLPGALLRLCGSGLHRGSGRHRLQQLYAQRSGDEHVHYARTARPLLLDVQVYWKTTIYCYTGIPAGTLRMQMHRAAWRLRPPTGRRTACVQSSPADTSTQAVADADAKHRLAAASADAAAGLDELSLSQEGARGQRRRGGGTALYLAGKRAGLGGLMGAFGLTPARERCTLHSWKSPDSQSKRAVCSRSHLGHPLTPAARA